MYARYARAAASARGSGSRLWLEALDSLSYSVWDYSYRHSTLSWYRKNILSFSDGGQILVVIPIESRRSALYRIRYETTAIDTQLYPDLERTTSVFWWFSFLLVMIASQILASKARFKLSCQLIGITKKSQYQPISCSASNSRVLIAKQSTRFVPSKSTSKSKSV